VSPLSRTVLWDPKAADGVVGYRLLYHSALVRDVGRVPLPLPPTVEYSRGGGWYEFIGMPPRPPGCL
jgi:hypothetical protein